MSSFFFFFLGGGGACVYRARLAQSVEHETLNLRVVGSSPTLGVEEVSFLCLSTYNWTKLLLRILLCKNL